MALFLLKSTARLCGTALMPPFCSFLFHNLPSYLSPPAGASLSSSYGFLSFLCFSNKTDRGFPRSHLLTVIQGSSSLLPCCWHYHSIALPKLVCRIFYKAKNIEELFQKTLDKINIKTFFLCFGHFLGLKKTLKK